MQLSSLLFALPAFLSNLTNPTGTESSPVTSPTFEMPTPISYILPKLPYEYNALEPHISEQIMKLHHSKHHQTYVNNLNAATASHVKALASGDVQAQIALQQAIKFNGGGHINHSLFWRSLAPASSPASSPSAAPKLVKAIEEKYGSLQNFQQELKTLLLGIQGSGWGWLVKTPKGELGLVTTKDQDPVETLGGNKKAIFGIDMWEHAYYLQYWNDKGKYVDEIWRVINWETAERRWFGDAAEQLKL